MRNEMLTYMTCLRDSVSCGIIKKSVGVIALAWRYGLTWIFSTISRMDS